MKISFGTTFSLLLLLAALLFPVPASAQEDEVGEEDERWGQLIVELSTWVAEPGGLGDNVASVIDPADPFNDTVLGFSRGTSNQAYSRLGAELAGNRGRLLVTWYAHDDEATLSARDPGNFIYGQLLAFPAFAGLNNDGLADAFFASSGTSLGDMKVEYSRVAFSNSRVEARWVAGFRTLKFQTNTDATYYALVPTFPAFVPPLTNGLPNLTPLPETAIIYSDYEGAGLTGGMEFEAPIAGDKFALEGSFGISILQGNVDTAYRATNHFYSLDGEILDPPYSELGDYFINTSGDLVGPATSVQQETIEVGLKSNTISRGSHVLELSVGARWNAMRFMDVFVGYRTIHYAGVGLELRPRNVVVIGNSINATDASEVERSATYEGFYGGVGFYF
jgi:hypothetical protein